MKKVSVIIPVYNCEKYLQRCLNSILEQTYRNFEVICINDCSTDKSQKILEEYQDKYMDLIKIFSNQINLGAGKTREKGIAVSKSEYIMFVDSYDFVDKDWMERYVLEIESQENLDMIIGGFTLSDEKKDVPQVVPDNEYSIFMYPSSCTRIYRKKFLEEKNINYGGVYRIEDNYWCVMIALSNPNYKIINDVGYHYWNNPQSVTRNTRGKDNCAEKEYEVLHNTIYNKIDFSKITTFQKHMIEYMFVSNTFVCLLTYNRRCGIKCMKEKYDYSIKNLKKYFPDFEKNPLLCLGKIKAGNHFCRMFVSIEFFLYKIGFGKILFYFRALI